MTEARWDMTQAPIPGFLSPEVYLRRPPSENEKYRLDRMLQAAAERGVKVNVVIFKEVPQFMSRK